MNTLHDIYNLHFQGYVTESSEREMPTEIMLFYHIQSMMDFI